MDLSILISALSLLVSILTELSTALREKNTDEIKKIRLSLLKLVHVLDAIIGVGEKLLTSIAVFQSDTPGAINQNRTIRELIDQQTSNLDALAKIYNTPITLAGQKVPMSVGSSIEILIPNKTEDTGLMIVCKGKKHFLRVLSWKLLRKPATPGQLEFAARFISRQSRIH